MAVEPPIEDTLEKERQEKRRRLSRLVLTAFIKSTAKAFDDIEPEAADLTEQVDPLAGVSVIRDLEKRIEYLAAKKAHIEERYGADKAPRTTAALAKAQADLNAARRKQEEEQGSTQSTNQENTRMSKEGQKDLSGADKIHNVEVMRHGEKLLLPENLSIKDAIALLQARDKYEQEVVNIVEVIDVFLWDGAYALANVLKARFGWVPDRGAQIIVETGVNERTAVPWGEFKLPGDHGKLKSSFAFQDGRWQYQIIATVMHRDERLIKEIMTEVREELKRNSLYRGKAFRISFFDEDGEKRGIPEVKFVDVSSVDEKHVAYAADVHSAIETNLWTPIRRVRELKANGIPVNRGVLLGGKFGTGKTLASAVATKLALEQGITSIYVARANELALALAFGKPYQDPAVLVFGEDIDREMAGGENYNRTADIDNILNSIDGIDTKGDSRIIVLTTNDLERIQPALLRPGRMDAVIEVTEPDAAAAWKLVTIYGGGTLAPNVDQAKVGKALEGQIPAVVAEVVRRAKLAELRRTPAGQTVSGISTEALVEAASTMRRQLELLNRGDKKYMPLEEALKIVRAAGEGSPAELPIGLRKAA